MVLKVVCLATTAYDSLAEVPFYSFIATVMWLKFQSETAIFPATFLLRKPLLRQTCSCLAWILPTMKYFLYLSLVNSRLCDSIQDYISCPPWYYSSLPTACQTLRQIFCVCHRSIIKNPSPIYCPLNVQTDTGTETGAHNLR